MIKIEQKRFLRPIFSFKGNFAPGTAPQKKIFDGVEIAPFWNACAAAVSISADFELNWAFRSLPAKQRDRFGSAERDNVPYILDLLNEYGVPITWATVGHLFLSSCTREGKHAHYEMPRPPANPLWQGDWYKHDPCTSLQRDPLWYAPDLIEQILKAKVAHEIGSHSFSHIDFSAHTSGPELVESEMRQCVALMAPLRLKLRSLVYPFNHMGHSYHDLLQRLGIIAVRHRDDKVRLSYPERSSAGVYHIYESMNLRSPNLYDYRNKAELFIDHALQHGLSYHLWFHPSDPRPVFQKEFQQILQLIQHERETGNVWVATMGDLAAYCEARECTSLQSRTEGDKRTIQIQTSLDTDKYGMPDVTLIVPAHTKPKRIERRIDGTAKELTAEAVCSIKNGALALNVPAVTQTISLSF
ncbi:MAG: polysaccharide deacetylase family protein [Candidatus Sulfotelmatobacter sp.]